LMCFTFRAGRASRSGSRASRSARAALAVCHFSPPKRKLRAIQTFFQTATSGVLPR
jgi:hypothetical protein